MKPLITATQKDRTMLPRHLRRLEAESIEIMRDVVAEFKKPVMLYSIGKDSSVMLHVALKAFHPAKLPFPLLHVDTTWKFRDMIAFRDETAQAARARSDRACQPGRPRPRHQSDRIRLFAAHPGDEDGCAEAGARSSISSMPPSAAPAATRRRAGRKSGSSRSARRAMAGTRAISARSCGICSTPGSGRARPCGCSRCRTGPSSMSGNTSCWKRFRWCRSILPPGGRWCAGTAP